MATKSFLRPDEVVEARALLKPPARIPDGDERAGVDMGARDFSKWLGEKLLARLSTHPEWLAAQPVILGSWARGGLSPRSDIDLLFCGPEEIVRKLVGDFALEGLKIRYRVPEDPADWTKGVEPFDIVALFSAVPLTPEAKVKLEHQLEKLRQRGKTLRRELLRAMRLERRARSERYDSITNFLEPNIKFGPGGLRDLEQALITRRLFPERFGDAEHAFQVLEYYKNFFLLIRVKLHLSDGAGDVLSAPEQRPISDWFGYKDPKDFMREVQKGLSRVSFYADWVIEQASASPARLKLVNARKLNSVDSLFSALMEDPSLLMQNRVRLAADSVFAQANQSPSLDRKIGKWLTRILDPMESEEPLVAFFRSRLIDHCVPEFRRVVGWVQHDQYHRYSVDAHLLQVIRELKRLCSHPSRAGRLAGLVRSLTASEREVLAFACLYHDLAKGRGGDHSVNGVEIAEEDLERFGKSAAFIQEVSWIVREHLALSAAAFRENPSSPRTWQALHEKGVKGRRLVCLAVFTIVDILGTNPEAWTTWKERLLFDLVKQLEKPETSSMLKFVERLRRAHFQDWERYAEELDPFLIGSIPAKTLSDDIVLVRQEVQKKKADLPPRVVRLRGGKQAWVRFHAVEDRPGIFLNFVKRLSVSGLSVRHASIHTDPDLGVYDWFEVKTSKPSTQILKLLDAAARASVDRQFNVRFDAIELVSKDNREWVISFRGRDQNGALAEAARALFELGLQIRWAKVHTWGRQIDDVFGVSPSVLADNGATVDSRELIEVLVKRFGAQPV